MRSLSALFYMTVILVSGCTDQLLDKQTKRFSLNSKLSTVQISIPDVGSIDWIVRPDLDIDPLILQCPQETEMSVIFKSDLETLELQVSGHDKVLVDILVDKIPATTLVECTIPWRTFENGNYDPDRASLHNYRTDFVPILDTYILPDEPGGILTIWEKGHLVFDYTRGYKDPVTKSPRQVSDHFDIASVSKEFTAIAILTLIDEGKLTLETHLSSFFPDLPNAEKITIYHLLTHSHGLPNYTDARGFDDTAPVDMDNIVKTMASMNVSFPAGTDYEYGNVSFFLLAKIGEIVSGQTHSEYIRTRLFKPAGMTESYFVTDESPLAEKVSGYYKNNQRVTKVGQKKHVSHSSGNGDIVSTMNDLQKWYRALSTGKVMSRDLFELAATPRTLNNGEEISRGFGFFVDTIDGERVIYNAGDWYTHTRYIYFAEQDKFVGLSTNNPIKHHDYTASDAYLHIVGKLINQEKFMHWGEEIDLSDL